MDLAGDQGGQDVGGSPGMKEQLVGHFFGSGEGSGRFGIEGAEFFEPLQDLRHFDFRATDLAAADLDQGRRALELDGELIDVDLLLLDTGEDRLELAQRRGEAGSWILGRGVGGLRRLRAR